MQRARKKVAEIDKVNSDLKKPSRSEINNKKDRKVLNRQVEVSREAVELKKRNSVSHSLQFIEKKSTTSYLLNLCSVLKSLSS